MTMRVEDSGASNAILTKVFGDECTQDSTLAPSILTSDFEAEVRDQFALISKKLDGVSMQVAQIMRDGLELLPRQPPLTPPPALPGGRIASGSDTNNRPRGSEELIRGSSPMQSFFVALGNFVAIGNPDIESKALRAETNELTEALSMLARASSILTKEMANRNASTMPMQLKRESTSSAIHAQKQAQMAQMKAEEEERKAKEKEAKMRKEREEASRANREHEDKIMQVSAVVMDVQRLINAGVIDGMLSNLKSEFECRQSVWQNVVPMEGENYKRCVEILTEKISFILHIGTEDLFALQSKLQEVSLIAQQSDALGKSMVSMINQLVEILRVAPHRSRLLKVLQGLEKDVRQKKSPQKLQDSQIDQLLQECLLEQSLKRRLEDVLHQEPKNPPERQDTKKATSQSRGRRLTN